MAKRRKIGLLFIVDDQWTGGLYYLYNIIRSFNYLDDAQKPCVVIFYNNASSIADVSKLDYQYLKFLPLGRRLSLARRFIAKVFWVLGWPTKSITAYQTNMVEFVFPSIWLSAENFSSLQLLKRVNWIPDFQDKYFPDFFSAEELAMRDHIYSKISTMEGQLVLSSMAAYSDFKKFYPNSTINTSVVPFATVVPSYEHLDIEQVLKKYNIENKIYFISPNQFWKHKNHIVILKAVELLIRRGVECLVLFTGKEFDNRDPNYTTAIKQEANQLGIQDYVRFLGFIDRVDQLKLMHHSLAVIQPSLFEGWSTVVEDAKAVGGQLIVSDLPVHREQCNDRAKYFDPVDENRLAELMIDQISVGAKRPISNYSDDIIKFANRILELAP